MLSISNTYKEKIINELISNSLVISFPQNSDIAPITEENIVSESMTLKQSICDENKLKFGGCIASEFDIQLINTEDRIFSSSLAGNWITVKLTQAFPSGEFLYPSNNLYPSNSLYPGEIEVEKEWTIFSGYIDSAKRSQDDRNIYEIVVYDRIAKLYDKNVSGKLYKKLKQDMGNVRTLLPLCLDQSLYNENDFNIVLSDDVSLSNVHLHNYDWMNNKFQISKGELLSNICEVCSGYGYFRPHEHKLRFLSASDEIRGTEIYKFYENLNSEEQTVQKYIGILFPYAGDIAYQDQGDTSKWGGKTGYYNNGKFTEVNDDFDDTINYYDMTDNILSWDYSDPKGRYDLTAIKRIYERFSSVVDKETTYIPLTATLDARLWVEVGDTIKIQIPETNVYGEYVDGNGNVVEDVANAKINTITSRVLSRTITGIQALTDTIEVKGEIS